MNKTGRGHIKSDFQFARFSLGGREFGIEVRGVKEIVRLKAASRPPGCPPFLEGFITLRNIVVPVIDLRKRFSLPVSAVPEARIIIISVDGLIAGLVVDSVGDVSAGGKETAPALQADEPWSACVEAVVECQGSPVRIINLSALLTDDEKLFLCAPFTEGQG